MNYAIITGTSKGLGASIAANFLANEVNVIGIARHANKELEEIANQAGTTYQHFCCDLANIDQLKDTFSKVTTQVFTKKTSYVYLINNAATVNPIDTANNHKLEEVQAHMQINTIAPMMTTSLLLKEANQNNTQVIIANVSSGAADRSTFGWSAYGASKAGLNRYTETVALEQKALGTNHKVILLDPSIMDTEMQGDIRSATKEQFEEIEQFKQFKEEDMLRDTTIVAGAFFDVLKDVKNIENGKYYRINDLLS